MSFEQLSVDVAAKSTADNEGGNGDNNNDDVSYNDGADDNDDTHASMSDLVGQYNNAISSGGDCTSIILSDNYFIRSNYFAYVLRMYGGEEAAGVVP